MKHRVMLRSHLRNQLPQYADTLGTTPELLHEALEWMLANNVAFEEGDRYAIASVNIEPRIEHALARRFYALLKTEIPATFVPLYGKNWATL